MSIGNTKLTIMINKIIKDLLSDGIYPTDYIVYSKLLEEISKNDPYSTYFQFEPIPYGSKYDNKKINQDIDKIYEDFSLLYRRAIEMNSRLIGKMQIFNMQKEALEQRIKELYEEAKALIAVKNSSLYSNCVFDSFVDSSKIDGTKSDIDLNLNENYVAIPNIESQSGIIKNNINVNVLTPGVINGIIFDEIKNGNPDDITNQYKNKSYDYTVKTKNKDGFTFMIEYDIEGATPDNPVKINKIVFNIESIVDTAVSVFYTLDNENYFKIPIEDNYVVVNGKKEITFEPIYATKLTFTLFKDKPDTTEQNGSQQKYVYKFMINEITLHSMQYAREGVLISKRLYPVKNKNNYISTATVYIEDEIPDGSDIEYYIAAYDETNPNWIRVSPKNSDEIGFPSTIDFKQISFYKDKQIRLNKDNNKMESMTVGENILYYLYTIDDEVMSCSIAKGQDACIIECCNLDKANSKYNVVKKYYYNLGDNGKIFDVTDFKNKIDNGKYDMYRIRFTIECSKRTNLSVTASITGKCDMFINGTKTLSTASGNNTKQISATLNQGLNKIVFETYDSENTNEYINLNTVLNNIDGVESIFANQNYMTEVDPFDLMYNTNKNSDCFALYTVGNTTYILINDDNENIKYNIDYRIKEKNIDSLLFKAVLKRSSTTEDSPKINRYVIYTM